MSVARKTAVGFATAMLVAACQLDSVELDRQIIDVHAARQDDDGVLLHVFVKNLGNGAHRDGSHKHCEEYCVKATWARDGSIITMQEGCNEEELRPDHVGVVKILARQIPRDGRVVIRLGMKKEDCPDCFQDESDGEWTLLSP